MEFSQLRIFQAVAEEGSITRAAERTGMPKGVFNMVFGGGVGEWLVKHPAIQAVGFTGSLKGGDALCRIAAERAQPIPVFAEMSSINPVIVLPGALAKRGEAIARELAGSVCMGAGQFCTNPGIAVVMDGPDADRLVAAARTALEQVAPQAMLTPGIAQAYREGVDRMGRSNAVRAVLTTDSADRSALPNLYETTADAFLGEDDLAEEVFGPLGLVVRAASAADMERIARGFPGQLTATLHSDPGDAALARRLLPELELLAGRVLFNGWPTGVEVGHAVVHGGPFPATSAPATTSVGSLAIERFLRPVSYQNIPDDLLPAEIRAANPLGIWRRIDGTLTRD